ncbi:hypothetical protein [Planctomicrobium sp. SH527]|uniref:hypothetical protein n=1 Tax=Planctomicrobium sp. SH527 TaxID=3448123 RepID=UPI003F5B077F
MLHAQMFFEAEAVFLNRDHNGGSPFVEGADPLSTATGSFSTEPGYRLGIGSVLENWQVDASFTQINPWTTSQSGVMSGDVSFDPTSSVPAPNLLSYNGFLSGAAQSMLNGDESINERFTTPEFATYARSNYRDAEINVGSSHCGRRWRLSGGFRHIQLDEKNGVRLDGIFSSDPSLTPGSHINGLSDAELTMAGANWIGGAGDGIVSGADLMYSLESNVENQLNGFQTTFAFRFIEKEWITLEGTLKAGVYQNKMHGQLIETAATSGIDNSVYQQAFAASDTGVAFAGNLGLKTIIGLTDYIDFVLGGEVLFLSGVALGADQAGGVSVTSTGARTYTVDNHGSLVGYGGSIGFRVYW